MAEEQGLPPLTPAATVQSDPAQAAASTTLPTLQAAPVAASSTLPPPVAAPVIPGGPGALPPLQAAPTVEQSSSLAATAGNRTISMLDMLRDHGHIMEDLEHNAASAGAKIFELGTSVSIPELAANGFFGKGSFFGTPGTDLPGTENETWLKRKAQILGNLNTKPILKLDNAITPEVQAAHPHLAVAAQPIVETLQSLTTPANLEFMGALGGVETMPKFAEATLLEKGVNPVVAARVAKTLKGGLTAMSAYFTYEQAKEVITKVPEAFTALINGEYDKAIGLGTAAFINGFLTVQGAHGTIEGARDFLPESTTAKALANKEYRDAVQEKQSDHQVGGGRAKQIADLGRKEFADQLKREQVTEYVDAKGNRNIMAARQKETANPVTPEQRLAQQGAFIPLDNQGMQPPPAEVKAAENETANTAKPAENGNESAAKSNETATPKRPVTTLGPATTNEEGVITHPILVDGKEVGHGTVKIEGDHATVDWVGGNEPDTTTGTTGKGELTNKLGLRSMRDLAKQFLTEHPEINTIEGQRIGGANAGTLHPVEFTREQLLPKLAGPIDKAINENPTFVSKAVAHRLGLFSEEAQANAQKPAEGAATTFTSPAAEKAGGLFSEEAQANAQKPGTATREHWESPAAQQVAQTATAVARAEEAARDHVITPEERDLMVKQQDPNFKMTQKQQSVLEQVRQYARELGETAQKYGILKKGQLKEWFAPRNWDFEDPSDPTKATLFDSHHEGQMHGLVSKNKDYFAAMADYYRKMSNRIADTKFVTRLKTGRMNDGAPMAVSGGFVDGQRVSAEGPQSHVMGEQEIQTLKNRGQFNKLIESGRIVANPDKSFTMKTDDYVKAPNMMEVRPIGPTPISPEIVKEMEADGTLAKLKEKGLVYQNEKGEWLSKQQLFARVPVYVHPDIATHVNEGVTGRYEYPNTGFGKVFKFYDDVQGNMKKTLLSWSPFHRVTEAQRMMESLGVWKGGKLAAQSTFGFAPKVDYFNLTDAQEAAIRDGIVVTDPRGYGPNNVEEGLSGGSDNWMYKTVDKTLGAGLEASAKKVFGASDETAAAIRRNINFQKILTDDVFGPHGTITDAKMALYADRKPLIAQRIVQDHPNWSSQEVDAAAGRIAAEWANNKFGGLNYVLLGRSASTQKFLKRILLAPDFLESTGRSVIDVAGTHGSELAARLVQFNIVHALTAAGINLALHHNENNTSPSGILKSSHIFDHPFGVVSPDGKSVYSVRTTMQDFLHMVNAPKEFAMNRVSPTIKAAVESWSKRNEYGRAESQIEALKSIPKATVPIQLQHVLGLGPNTTTEPSATDQFLKSIGIQAKPNRSDAEQLAIQKVSQRLQGTEARTGQDLVRHQLKFNAEDNLRAALEAQKAAKQSGSDVAKAKERVDAANLAIQMLAQKKVLAPEDVKNIRLTAQAPRLVSIFNSLDPKDALEVWDKATDDERVQLGPHMQQKYAHWREKLAKSGQNINQLTADDQEVQDHFTQARIQANEAIRKPLPPPPAAKVKPAEGGGNAEKASAPAAEETLPPLTPAPVMEQPASLQPPKAPEVYKKGDYTGLINDSAKKYGVDPTLVEAIMHRESAGNAGAQSNKGAMGLMQLEPGTAKHYGVTDPKDPRQNIDAGTHYISDLLKQYDGDEKKALAAYNAGPTAVAQYGGVPPFKETKEYVKAVQGHKAANYQNSSEFKPTEDDAKTFQHWPKTGPSTAPGMVKPGNIDLTTRPVVHRPNGEVSTLYSASFGTDDGEVLVPLISPKGKVLTVEEAKKQYEKDGKSLGVFKTPEQADEYANFLHEQQGKFQVWTNGGQYRPSVETYSDK